MITRPSTETAEVVLVSQEKMTLSFLTAPVFASTFSSPNIFCRAAIRAGSAKATDEQMPHIANTNNADMSCFDFMRFLLVQVLVRNVLVGRHQRDDASP